MKPKEVVEFANKNDVKFVDLKFIDFPGIWQHTTVPANRLTEACFEEGFGFDGSSIRGWQPINASDMLIVPDPETAKLDPFTAHTTLSVICSVSDPITGQPYSRDPRFVAKKAEAYLRQSGIGVGADRVQRQIGAVEIMQRVGIDFDPRQRAAAARAVHHRTAGGRRTDVVLGADQQ